MKCLQEMTGSCRGCNVLEIVQNRAKVENPKVATRRISIQLCPTNLQPQEHLVAEGQREQQC